VLQVTCERLFRTAGARKRPGRRQLNREKPWIITLSDLVHLGELDQQIDLYVYETIQEEIQRQLPMFRTTQLELISIKCARHLSRKLSLPK
jgi:hypothetical protein